MKNLIEESRKLAISEIEKFGLPNILHFELSEKKGIELANKLGIDTEIVQIGTYLMDLKLGQAFKEGRVSEHVNMSIEATKTFLNTRDINNNKKEKIINCVAAHHGTVSFICKEAEVCANADCYRFIHPKGFFLFLTILGGRESDFAKNITFAEKKLDEKYNILSLDICKNELNDIYKNLKKYISLSR